MRTSNPETEHSNFNSNSPPKPGAEPIIAQELRRLRWNSTDLRLRLKSDPTKTQIAARLRAETTPADPLHRPPPHLRTRKSANARIHTSQKTQTQRKTANAIESVLGEWLEKKRGWRKLCQFRSTSMTADQIIEDIKLLPRDEQSRVVQFAVELAAVASFRQRTWSLSLKKCLKRTTRRKRSDWKMN